MSRDKQSQRTEEEGHLCQKDCFEYRSLVGALLYLANLTRVDICYAVLQLSRGMARPNSTDLVAEKRVLRYLRGTTNFKLKYGSQRQSATQAVTVTGYSDATWGSLDDARSVTGYLVYVGTSLVTFGSRIQRCVSRSSTEAELIAGSYAAREMTLLQKCLGELGISVCRPSTLYIDNLAAVNILTANAGSNGARHIVLAIHGTRESVKGGHVKPVHVRSGDQLSDGLTKHLSKPQFTHIISRIIQPAWSR